MGRLAELYSRSSARRPHRRPDSNGNHLVAAAEHGAEENFDGAEAGDCRRFTRRAPSPLERKRDAVSRRKRKLPIAAMLSHHDRFSTMSADQKARILQKVKERPTEWRLAVVFKTTHQPQAWDAGVNGRNQPVRFLVSTQRNAAGWYLGWREVANKNGSKETYDYICEKERERCRERILARALRYAEEQGNTAEATALRSAGK